MRRFASLNMTLFLPCSHPFLFLTQSNNQQQHIRFTMRAVTYAPAPNSRGCGNPSCIDPFCTDPFCISIPPRRGAERDNAGWASSAPGAGWACPCDRPKGGPKRK